MWRYFGFIEPVDEVLTADEPKVPVRLRGRPRLEESEEIGPARDLPSAPPREIQRTPERIEKTNSIKVHVC
jgi:hypothetical protein